MVCTGSLLTVIRALSAQYPIHEYVAVGIALQPLSYLRPIRDVPDVAFKIARTIRDAGGRALIVGGWVRDRLAGLPANDLDWEVRGLNPEQLEQVLTTLGKVTPIGDFGIYLLYIENEQFEVALPRTEEKTGPGYKGFDIHLDPDLSYMESFGRRGITSDALGYDPLAEAVIDPYGGQFSLENRRLHVIDELSFAQDPVRVVRLAYISAKMDFDICPDTLAVCRSMRDELHTISTAKRAKGAKGILLSPAPGRGLQALNEAHALDKVYPIWANDRLAQTIASLNAGAEIVRRELGDQKRRLGIMAAIGLADAGEEQARAFLAPFRYGKPPGSGVLMQDFAAGLIREIHTQPADDRQLYELSQRLGKAGSTIPEWGMTVEAYAWGHDKEIPAAVQRSLERFKQGKLERLIEGRHLVRQLGCKPGPYFSPLLQTVYEAQLDGQIGSETEGLELARRLLPSFKI